MRFEMKVNGARRAVESEPGEPLLSVLRDEFALTGTKYGCGEGQCGACMVLIDGVPAPACITPSGSAAGKEVTTVEGLEREGRLHAVQEAFLEEDAFQCGYCTPGMIVTGAALLASNPTPSRQEIVAYLDGNICRCGLYGRIIDAIQRAAARGEG
jgi:aerobic-type carbon monoxide dehydrogenase small subunit (CoxS/CutS family)